MRFLGIRQTMSAQPPMASVCGAAARLKGLARLFGRSA